MTMLNIEFFSDPNLRDKTYYSENGKDWEPISHIDANKKRVVFEAMRNDKRIKTKMDYIRHHQHLTTVNELFNALVPVVFGKLNHVWDYANGQINPEL